MPTKYAIHFRLIAPSNKGEYEGSIAQQISQAFEAACPDVGPDNVSTPLNTNGDDGPPTHFMFSAPLEPRHLAAIETLGLHKLPGVKFWRADRSGDLKEKFDAAKPAKATISDASVLAEAGVKLRKPVVKI